MKNGKTPTRAQREIIQAHRLNADNWFVVKNTATDLVIISKKLCKDGSHKTRTIAKI